MTGAWLQNYDPLGSQLLSPLCSALPVCLLCYLMAVRRTPAWKAALAGVALGAVIALAVFRMPPAILAGAVAHALVFGVLRVVLNLAAAVFVYDLVVESGRLKDLSNSICAISGDRRIQVLLVAFGFSAILEGTGGGGAPVAISAAILMGLGFKPFDAAVFGLLGNTVPVVYGGMGNPVRTLAVVTGLTEAAVSQMLGVLLAPLALLVPACLVWRDSGTKGIREAWPAILVSGGSFALIFFLGARFLDIALVAVISGAGCIAATAAFVRLRGGSPAGAPYGSVRAWLPFLLLIAFIILWGIPAVKRALDATTLRIPVPGLHMMVVRQPPVVPAPQAEAAVFDIAWLAGSGSAALLSGLVAGPLLGLGFRKTCAVFGRSVYRIREGIVAILGMLSLGFLTRYSGMDAVLGLALVNTGPLFPFFGTILGWLGVLITGTNAGSNALFGSLQTITARNLGLSELLMASANAAGGVMGKMVNAQSLVVGCAAAGITGREGDLFRTLLRYSLALAAIVGLIVTLIAYRPGLIPR